MTRRVLLLVLLLVVVAAAGAWRQGWLATTPAPPPVQPTPTPPPRFQSAWATEQKWLVDRIKRDIREMAALGAGRTTAAGDAEPAKSEPIRVVEHLFAPRTFTCSSETAVPRRTTRRVMAPVFATATSVMIVGR